MARLRECGSKVDVVTCPLCVRGVSILGAHERLRPVASSPFISPSDIDARFQRAWRIWEPGDKVYTDYITATDYQEIAAPTGTIIEGLIREVP